jgi:hypothetical protein
MAFHKKDKKRPPGWTTGPLTSSLKFVKSVDSLEHIGNQLRHLQDQAKAKLIAERRILKNLGLEQPNWEGELVKSLAAVGLLPSGVKESEQAALERSVDEALANRGVRMVVGNVPIGGDRLNGRKWEVMENVAWVDLMKEEKRWRGSHRSGRTLKKGHENLALEAVYCRLPPWLATEVKKKLDSDPQRVSELLIEMGARYGKRFGVDVVGIGLHSENHQDWHIHILFSRSLEQIKEKGTGEAGRKEKTKLCALIKEELKKEQLPATNRAVGEAYRKAISEGRFTDPLAAGRRVVYKRRGRYCPEANLRAMGPAYRNKYWIYRAAEGTDRDKVAAACDRSVESPGAFRWLLANLQNRDSSPEEYFTDAWAESQWHEMCRSVLDVAELAKVEESRCKAVENYLEIGTTLPTPMELIAAHVQKNRERIKELEAEVAAKEATVGRFEQMRAEIDVLRKLQANAEAEATRKEEQWKRYEKVAEDLKKQNEALLAQERELQGKIEKAVAAERARRKGIEAEADNLRKELSAVGEEVDKAIAEGQVPKGILGILKKLAARLLPFREDEPERD